MQNRATLLRTLPTWFIFFLIITIIFYDLSKVHVQSTFVPLVGSSLL